MKNKLIFKVIFFILGCFLANNLTSPVYGETYEYQCESGGIFYTNIPQPFLQPFQNVTFTFNVEEAQELEYRMTYNTIAITVPWKSTAWQKASKNVIFTINTNQFKSIFLLEYKLPSGSAEKYTGSGDSKRNYSSCSFIQTPSPTPTPLPSVASCLVQFADPVKNLGDITFIAKEVEDFSSGGGFYKLEVYDQNNSKKFETWIYSAKSRTISENIGTWPSGEMFIAKLIFNKAELKQKPIVSEICAVPFTPGSKEPPPTVVPGQGTPTPTPIKASAICNGITDDPTKSDDPYDLCMSCINDKNGVWTALGCISTDISGFIGSFFKIGLGVAGGIALLFLIYGGFLVMTSAGNPETIQQGKDILTSAITGLLLIIFSVFLIQLISVDILKIPGFSTEPIPTQPIPTSPPATTCSDPAKPKACGNTCCQIDQHCNSTPARECTSCPTSLCGERECCDLGEVCQPHVGGRSVCLPIIPTSTLTPTPSPTPTFALTIAQFSPPSNQSINKTSNAVFRVTGPKESLSFEYAIIDASTGEIANPKTTFCKPFFWDATQDEGTLSTEKLNLSLGYYDIKIFTNTNGGNSCSHNTSDSPLAAMRFKLTPSDCILLTKGECADTGVYQVCPKKSVWNCCLQPECCSKPEGCFSP